MCTYQRFRLFVLAILIAGCAGLRETFKGPADENALVCAEALVQRLGYTVTMNDGAMLVATHTSAGANDRISVTLKTLDDGSRIMQATAEPNATYNPPVDGRGGGIPDVKFSTGASEQARLDAEAIIRTCSKG